MQVRLVARITTALRLPVAHRPLKAARAAAIACEDCTRALLAVPRAATGGRAGATKVAAGGAPGRIAAYGAPARGLPAAAGRAGMRAVLILLNIDPGRRFIMCVPWKSGRFTSCGSGPRPAADALARRRRVTRRRSAR